MGAAKAYLVAYNVAQTAGWAVTLYLAVQSIAIAGGCLSNVFADTYPVVGAFQALSLLEMVHAALGLVGGSPLFALMQWAGRSNVLFAVVHAIPELWGTKPAGLLILAWALSEVIRYPWYVASQLGACPGWLTWLRYTAFIPLYPLGVWAELALMWEGLPHMASRGLHSLALPNALNFGFRYDVFIKVVMLAYPFLWFQLYSFLFRQRAKKLRCPSPARADKRE